MQYNGKEIHSPRRTQRAMRRISTSAAYTISFVAQKGTNVLPVAPYNVPQSLSMAARSVQHIMATQTRHTSTRHLGPTLRPKWTAMARQDVAVRTHRLTDLPSKPIYALAMRRHMRRPACRKRGRPFERSCHRQ